MVMIWGGMFDPSELLETETMNVITVETPKHLEIKGSSSH